MGTDGRITPDRVKAAFRELGHDWNPAQGSFLTLDQYADGDEWNDCCGLTAVYLASIPAETRHAVALGLDRDLGTDVGEGRRYPHGRTHRSVRNVRPRLCPRMGRGIPGG